MHRYCTHTFYTHTHTHIALKNDNKHHTTFWFHPFNLYKGKDTRTHTYNHIQSIMHIYTHAHSTDK